MARFSFPISEADLAVAAAEVEGLKRCNAFDEYLSELIARRLVGVLKIRKRENIRQIKKALMGDVKKAVNPRIIDIICSEDLLSGHKKAIGAVEQKKKKLYTAEDTVRGLLSKMINILYEDQPLKKRIRRRKVAGCITAIEDVVNRFVLGH